jgi:hypothetical protein
MKQLSKKEAGHLASVGLGFTPNELTQLTQLIDNTIEVRTATVGGAVDKRATAAAENAVMKSILISSAIGIVGGGILGWVLVKKL